MGFKIIYNYAIGFMETWMVHTLKLYVFGQHYIITFELEWVKLPQPFYMWHNFTIIFTIYTWWREMGIGEVLRSKYRKYRKGGWLMISEQRVISEGRELINQRIFKLDSFYQLNITFAIDGCSRAVLSL